MNSEETEYGQLYSDGSMLLWSQSDDVLKVYPLDEQIEHAQRRGGKVYRRRVIVVGDWEEVPKCD